MKKDKIIPILAAAGLLVWAAGCGQKDTTAEQDLHKADVAAGNAMKDVTEAAKQTGEKVLQDVKQAGETVAKDATQKAQALAAPVNAKAQEIIDSAKKLFTDGKLQESLAKLKELGAEKLSADQKAVVDGLNAQIEKASKAGSDAAKAAGNLLK